MVNKNNNTTAILKEDQLHVYPFLLVTCKFGRAIRTCIAKKVILHVNIVTHKEKIFLPETRHLDV